MDGGEKGQRQDRPFPVTSLVMSPLVIPILLNFSPAPIFPSLFEPSDGNMTMMYMMLRDGPSCTLEYDQGRAIS